VRDKKIIPHQDISVARISLPRLYFVMSKGLYAVISITAYAATAISRLLSFAFIILFHNVGTIPSKRIHLSISVDPISPPRFTYWWRCRVPPPGP